VGRSAIESGAADTVLVIGVETLSKIVDWTDRNTCVLFGDAAGAVVLRSTGAPGGILATRLHSDGSLVHLLEMPAGGSLMPPSHETVAQRLHTIHMSGNDVFKHAVRAMESVALEALEAAGTEARGPLAPRAAPGELPDHRRHRAPPRSFRWRRSS
jgi:3-oxoacyl-[acyl-carrier-protein] synthase-3